MDGNVLKTANNDIHPATLLAMADRKWVCVAGRWISAIRELKTD